MRNEPSKHDDLIDSRDLIEYAASLRGERDDLLEDIAEDEAGPDDLAAWDAENLEELESVEAFIAECEDYAPDWHYGETLIAEHYFTEYAQQLAEDIGAVDRDGPPWPASFIDWPAAAEALKADYTAVEWNEKTFYIR